MAVSLSNRLYPEEDMLMIWNDYWGNNNEKYTKVPRRERPSIKTKLSTINPKYHIAFDGEIPIAYSGIEDNGTFVASAGVYIIPEYQKRGLSEKLLDMKLEEAGSKPYITFINNLNSYWINFLNRKGLHKADLENLPDGIPKEVAQKEIDAYGENNVLIYSSRVTKSWSNILVKNNNAWKEILKVKATATHNSKGKKKDRCALIADQEYKEHGAYKSGAMERCRQGKIWVGRKP